LDRGAASSAHKRLTLAQLAFVQQRRGRRVAQNSSAVDCYVADTTAMLELIGDVARSAGERRA
jgi:hypothetical protein